MIKIKLSIKPLLMGEYSWEKKNLPTKAEDARETGSISGSGRSPGVGNGNPLQYSSWTEESGGLQLVGSQGVGYN